MNRASISDIKVKAKDNLLGCYKTATGSFALLFILLYGLAIVLGGALTAGTSPAELAGGSLSLTTEIKTFGISAVVSLFSTLLSTGYTKMMMEISYGRKPRMRDLFYAFGNHPDKAIIIFAILLAVEFVVLLPTRFIEWTWDGVLYGNDGKNFLVWVIFLVIGECINIFVSVLFGFCYMVYIEDPEMSVKDILLCSKRLMNGNKLRYVYLILSFVGYYVLAIFSLGVTLMYTAPYQSMSCVELYKDAIRCADRRNEEAGTVAGNEEAGTEGVTESTLTENITITKETDHEDRF